MRKLFAIFFLSIYLFNLAGYSTFFRILIDDASNRLETALDRELYSEEELVEIRLPLHLPYVTGSNEYQRINGHIFANGRYYNYVKRKISADTLFLYCMPNKQVDRLLQAKNEYGKLASDLPSSQKEEIPGKKGSSVFQYQEQAPDFLIQAVGTILAKEYTLCSFILATPYIDTPYQPPESMTVFQS